ncbi:MAG: H-NS histone family protein [Methyloprofundus sp.]|nr:H-NS histone family protein [Methyloprofundus sp.]
MNDLKNFSVSELQAVIDNAEAALKMKQNNERKEVYAKIKELAASVGATVDIYMADKKETRKTVKVEAKFRHPSDASLTWTGRGLTPKWMRALIEEGHEKSEFLI